MTGADREAMAIGGRDVVPPDGPEPPPLPVYSSAEIEQALAAVPPFERHVFLMHRSDGLSYDEIARQLGISERRVLRLMTRALTAMRRAIEKIERRRR